jgi:hypothetical protein
MDGQRVKAYVADLRRSRPDEVQERAVRELVRLGPEVLPLLWPGTDKPQWKNIVRVIREIGYPANAAAIPSLLKRLQDLNWPGSCEAMDELLEIGAPVIPHLRTVLREHWDDDMWIWNIHSLLLRMEPALAAELVPELLHILQAEQPDNPDWDANWAMIEPLGHVGSPAADPAIPILAAYAADTQQVGGLRLDALAALQRFTSLAPETAVRDVQRCLEDPSEEIRRRASVVLETWQQHGQ